MVEHPYFIRGVACSIPGKNIIFKLEEVLIRNVIHVIHVIVIHYVPVLLEEVLLRNVIHVIYYLPVLLSSHHLQVHSIFHYVPVTPPPHQQPFLRTFKKSTAQYNKPCSMYLIEGEGLPLLQ
jgi:hypothetical protein